MAEKDLIEDAKAELAEAEEAEGDNRDAALDDLKFARLAEQWPDQIKKQRDREKRPCLTINRIPAFARQITNDIRQNRPSIVVKPVDSGADRETADILSGLVRNIEVQSGADVAYDTAAENAVYGGFGYFRVDVDYSYDDSFDMDIRIVRVANPFSVYGDPKSTEADSCDWNRAFLVDRITRSEFKSRFKEAEVVDFREVKGEEAEWWGEDDVRICEWWKREQVEREIIKLSNGIILPAEQYQANQPLFSTLQIVGTRKAKTHKVIHRLISGAEVLEEKVWAGKYIPLIPVFGEEIWIEGKRHLKSLFRDAKDAQRMFNFWRTAATESVALAPKVPFVGPVGAFKSDKAKWESANVKSWPYIEFDGPVAPQRQPLDMGAAAGAMSEALAAQDDMKSIMGIYDASLGQRSNETSGRAILARQREGDVSTMHFVDNLSRAIRHCGRILIDLIPAVYTGERILRVLGEDGTVQNVPVNQPVIQTQQGWQKAPMGAPQDVTRVFDLSTGKYDVEVRSGPGFTTRREEAALGMQAMFQANPATTQVLGDIYARMQDWPEADKVEKRLQALLPPHIKGEAPPPEVQQMQQAMQQMQAQGQQLAQENAALKADKGNKTLDAQIKAEELQMERERLEFEREKLAFEREKLGVEVVEARMEAQQEAQRVAGEQLGLFAQQSGASIEPIARSVEALAERLEQVAEQVNRPRTRKGRAVKGPDGSWMLEAMDEPPMMQ